MLDQCLELLDSGVKEYADAHLAFLRPVLLYLFCDPNYHAHFGALRAALFDRLLEGCKTDGSCDSLANNSCDSLATNSCFSCLEQLMTWLQLDNKNSLPEVAGYVVKFFSFLLTAVEEEKRETAYVDNLIRYQLPTHLNTLFFFY